MFSKSDFMSLLWRWAVPCYMKQNSCELVARMQRSQRIAILQLHGGTLGVIPEPNKRRYQRLESENNSATRPSAVV